MSNNLILFESKNGYLSESILNELRTDEISISKHQPSTFKITAGFDFIIYVESGIVMLNNHDTTLNLQIKSTLYCSAGKYQINDVQDNAVFSILFIQNTFLKQTIIKYANHNTLKTCDVLAFNKTYCLTNSYFIKNTIYSLMSFIKKDKRLCRKLLSVKIEELILTILEGNDSNELKQYLYSKIDQVECQLKTVMEKHFTKNYNLTQYAELCGMSLSSFKRYFVDYFGINPGRWLIKRRLLYSEALLKRTNLNVNEVAYMSGFENTSHFIKVYKEEYNFTPMEYRNRVSNNFQCA